MPGLPVDIDVGITGCGEDAVRLSSLGCGGGVVDGRADQRMVEPHHRPEQREICRFRGFRGRLGDAQFDSRPPQSARLPGLVGRGEQQ